MPTIPTMAASLSQIEYWNGPAGERWAIHQEALDRALEPFGLAALGRANIRPGERVLDVGCGCGATTLAIADRIGESGRVLGIDVSSRMLAEAARRTAGRSNVALLEADAATHRFSPSADVIASRFGVMFFERPVDAFRNLRGALAPAGRLAFACWRAPSENPWVSVPMNAALRHVGAPPPSGPDEPGPFSFADRGRVEDILRAAGFSAVRVEPFDADVVLSIAGIEPALEFAITAGMAGRLLADAPPNVADAVREDLRGELVRARTGERVTLGGAVWIASATA
jgi:SAM-dependent methyltransferase